MLASLELKMMARELLWILVVEEMDEPTSEELLSEPGLKVSAILDPGIGQGRQEGSGMITSKRIVLEWTLHVRSFRWRSGGKKRG